MRKFVFSRRRQLIQWRQGAASMKLERLEERSVPDIGGALVGVTLAPWFEPHDPTRSLVVQFEAPITDESDGFASFLMAPSAALHEGFQNWRIYQVARPEELDDVIAQFRAMPNVVSAEAMQTLAIAALPNSFIPNDPSLTSLWGMHNTGQNGGTVDADIDAVEAWDLATSATNIVLADIDTGIDYRHPDLYLNIWINPGEIPANVLPNLADIDGDGVITFWDLNDPSNQGAFKITDQDANGRIDGADILKPVNGWGTGGWADVSDTDANGFVDDLIGWDFYNNDNNPLDDNNHGTHTTGTIAGLGDNGVGVVGVTHRARIMALKFLNSGGSGSDVGAAAAIDYSWRHGAKISSNSWGGGNSALINSAIDAARTAGQLFVAAAGNSGQNTDISPFYPAGAPYNNILAVGSTDRNDLRSSFSNYGATSVDLFAPGSSIYSTVINGGYASFSGTSMATPHVAGAAALLWAQHSTWTYTDVINRLLGTVDVLPALTGKAVSNGRLNVYKALAGLTPGDTPGAGPDLLFNSAVAGGTNQVTVNYTVSGAAVTPFQIGFYRSSDETLGGDILLDWISVTNPADLAVGAHSLVLTLGTGANQIMLPDFGRPNDASDYHLLVVLDRLQQVVENDLDSFLEDNAGRLTGIYHAALNKVLIHGTGGNDLVNATTSVTTTVTFNGTPYGFTPADVTGVEFRGGAGDDSMLGNGLSHWIMGWGGAGNDTFLGGLGADTFEGGLGADTWLLQGTTGNDTISVLAAVASQAKTTFQGTDYFTFDANDLVEIRGDAGNDSLSIDSGLTLPGWLKGEAGKDTLNGGAGPDTLWGGDAADTLNGRLGNNVIDGHGDTDTWNFEGSTGADFMDLTWDALALELAGFRRASLGGSPIDSTRTKDIETLVVLGSGGNDRIDLTGFTSAMASSAGVTKQTLDGGTGNDTLLASPYKTSLKGGDGNDELFGNSGNDSLDGGLGNDSVHGGGGTDLWTYQGTNSDDVINVDWDAGNARLVLTRQAVIAGPVLETEVADGIEKMTVKALNGNDRIDFSALSLADIAAAGLVNQTADGGKGNDSLYGSDGNDSLLGNDGADYIFGGAGNDTMNGGAGNDTMDGGLGNDSMLGGDGNDSLFGNDGDDTLNGGNGTDTLDGGDGTDTALNGELLLNFP